MTFPAILYRYKFHHLLFWLALFGLWYYFRYQDFRTTEQALLVTLLKVADLALLVYVTNHVLIPRLVYQKQYFAFAVVFILMICTTSMAKLYLIGDIIHIPGFNLFDQQLKVRVYDNVIPHFLLVSTGAAFKLLLDHAKAQKRLGEMAKEKAEAELDFLKNQINPHFVFNSLNSVYFLIDKRNTAARSALHKFSDMLRYQLYELKGDKIPIEKEISYLEDYISLQQLRRTNCEVKLDIDPAAKGFYIEPLLLIPFIENSFKHLSHFDNGKANEVCIHLQKQNGFVDFTVKNTTEDHSTDTKQEGGIGLSNVKRRLELLYPGKHRLSVERAHDWFNVHLNISIGKQ
jgi:two-component system LytT family sensor kinase